MTVLAIQARISCDDCAKTFVADIDPAASYDNGFAAAEAAMLGGDGSYFDGVMRCDACTDTHVQAWIAAHPNAISEIHPVPIDGGWRVVTFAGGEHFVPQDHPAGEPKFEAEVSAWITPSPTGAQS